MSAHTETSTWPDIKGWLTPPFLVPVTILLAVLVFHLVHGPIIPGPM